MEDSEQPWKKLPQHIAFDDVEDAILRSGYPLQSFVSAQLSQNVDFSIEEWAFIDSDTGQQRAIDLYCLKELYDFDSLGKFQVRPQLNLLIECKKSELPYVFFRSNVGTQVSGYPVISGLRSEQITFKMKGDLSTYSLPVLRALGMEKHQLITSPPVQCRTLSKLVANGKKLSLSGDEPFMAAVLPMTKAMSYFERTSAPSTTAIHFDLHMIFGMVVLDAPMLVVDTSKREPVFDFAPWVRLYRNTTVSDDQFINASHTLSIDFVHRDFVQQFVTDHVTPFAEELSERALRRQNALSKCEATIPNTKEFPWSDIADYF